MTTCYAKALGSIAFAQGLRRSPCTDAGFMQGLAGLPVGSSAPFSRAWLAGWDEAWNAAEASK